MFNSTRDDFLNLAESALDSARKLGADGAVVDLTEAIALNVTVRHGQTETIETTRDKGFGVTVYAGQRRGHASSSDLSPRALEESVRAAWDIARFTAEDEYAGLPEPELLARDQPDLALFHPWTISADQAVELAKQVEAAAFAVSPAIRNSEGAAVSASHGHFVFANSLGFRGGYPYSRHSVSCTPIAERGKQMQRDNWYSSERDPSRLASPDALGRYAAQRALLRLGGRKVRTGRAPVLFEAPLALGLIGSLVQAVSGAALYRRSTFLLDTLGKTIFAPHLDLIEDPSIPGEFGSATFDDEGVATQRRHVIEQGVLQGYFLSCYSARKLGMRTTGNAGGSHNLQLSSRLTAPSDDLPAMLRKMGRGLLVTELLGQGINYVTGDYSRGVTGYWVDGGVIVHPVEEVTIAGNLKDMYKSIVAIGADAIRRGAKRSGSVLIESMAIAGN
jgi:PmbA protein